MALATPGKYFEQLTTTFKRYDVDVSGMTWLFDFLSCYLSFKCHIFADGAEEGWPRHVKGEEN